MQNDANLISYQISQSKQHARSEGLDSSAGQNELSNGAVCESCAQTPGSPCHGHPESRTNFAVAKDWWILKNDNGFDDMIDVGVSTQRLKAEEI